MFAKLYEIPSLPFQDIEKPKRRGWTNTWTDGRDNSIPLHKYSLQGVLLVHILSQVTDNCAT